MLSSLASNPSSKTDLVGVMLIFEPLRSRIVTETIENFAELGTDQDVSAVSGVGKVMRILRCARISAPRTPDAYMDKPVETCALLERALSVELLLELKARSPGSLQRVDRERCRNGSRHQRGRRTGRRFPRGSLCLYLRDFFLT